MSKSLITFAGLAHINQYGKTRIEVLQSKNYLTKLGFQSELNIPINESNHFVLNTGVFTRQDAGSLFVSGADSTLDFSREADAEKRLNHDGFGAYLQLGVSNHQPGISNSISITNSS